MWYNALKPSASMSYFFSGTVKSSSSSLLGSKMPVLSTMKPISNNDILGLTGATQPLMQVYDHHEIYLALTPSQHMILLLAQPFMTGNTKKESCYTNTLTLSGGSTSGYPSKKGIVIMMASSSSACHNHSRLQGPQPYFIPIFLVF